MNPLIHVLSIVALYQWFGNAFQSTTILSRNRNRQTSRLHVPRIKATNLHSLKDDEESGNDHAAEHTIRVHYENRSCDIVARSDETILSALERNQLSLENLGLPNSAIPSDCRRGNCLTCTTTHASGSSKTLVSDGDGLSPHISQTIQEKGYILACSSRVVGEGLQLNLGENQKVWRDIYQDRLEREPTQEEKWAAMARSKRQSDERNQAMWEQKMEGLVQEKSSGESKS